MKRILTVLPAAALMLCGCSFIRMSNDNETTKTKTTFTAYVPWAPWQDSANLISRVNVSAATNKFTGSLRDLSQTTETSTNAVAVIEAVVGAAVKAAVGVAAK